VVVVAVVLLVVAVALAVALARTRGQLQQAQAEAAVAGVARDEADAARRRAEGDAATAAADREDALEREKRAKREAADVAKRLKEEHQALAEAEAAVERAQAELAVARDELAAARAGDDVDQLWALALAGVRRTWEVSVAPSPGMPSPLDDAADPLRAAIEVEVDAAREEAGAAIELEWTGDAVAPPAVALRALSITQALIGRLAKVSEDAVLRVASEPDGVRIEVDGTDGEGRSVVPEDVAAEHQVAPGRYLLSA